MRRRSGPTPGGVARSLRWGGGFIVSFTTLRPHGRTHRHVNWRLAAVDAVLLTAAWWAALALRYDAQVPADAWAGWWSHLPVWIFVALLCNTAASLYSGVWRHASVYEARRVILALGVTVLVVMPTVLVAGRPVPLSVPLVAGVLSVGLVGAVRFQSRLRRQRRASDDVVRLIVIGAGSAGVALAADALRRGDHQRVVAFLDDDTTLQGRHIHGVRVEGGIDDLPAVAKRLRVSCAILAVPSAAPELVRRVAALAESTEMVLRVVPRLADLVDAQVQLKDVRDIEPGDLLGRGQIETDLDAVISLVRGRRVLVTGAGGSIGSEIARQVAGSAPSGWSLVDHDETHLFDAAARPARRRPCSVLARHPRAARPCTACSREQRPEVVFHAAAHKHVPLLEAHPCEAVRTNVLGTANVVAGGTRGRRRAVRAHLHRQGRAAQQRHGRVQAARRAARAAAALRLDDRVLRRPLRQRARQPRQRGPDVRAADPRGRPGHGHRRRMTRYFMSIPEAVQLVLHAAALSAGSARSSCWTWASRCAILDLAERMIRLSGRRPGLDIEIRVTGVRPGEKLAEELRTPAEHQQPTTHPSIMRLRPTPVPLDRLDVGLGALRAAVEERNDEAVRAGIFALLHGTPVVRIPAQTRSQIGVRESDVAWT